MDGNRYLEDVSEETIVLGAIAGSGHADQECKGARGAAGYAGPHRAPLQGSAPQLPSFHHLFKKTRKRKCSLVCVQCAPSCCSLILQLNRSFTVAFRLCFAGRHPVMLIKFTRKAHSADSTPFRVSEGLRDN